MPLCLLPQAMTAAERQAQHRMSLTEAQRDAQRTAEAAKQRLRRSDPAASQAEAERQRKRRGEVAVELREEHQRRAMELPGWACQDDPDLDQAEPKADHSIGAVYGCGWMMPKLMIKVVAEPTCGELMMLRHARDNVTYDLQWTAPVLTKYPAGVWPTSEYIPPMPQGYAKWSFMSASGPCSLNPCRSCSREVPFGVCTSGDAVPCVRGVSYCGEYIHVPRDSMERYKSWLDTHVVDRTIHRTCSCTLKCRSSPSPGCHFWHLPEAEKAKFENGGKKQNGANDLYCCGCCLRGMCVYAAGGVDAAHRQQTLESYLLSL